MHPGLPIPPPPPFHNSLRVSVPVRRGAVGFDVTLTVVVVDDFAVLLLLLLLCW